MAAGTLSRGVGRARGAGPGTLLFFVALMVSAGALVLWLSDLTFWRDEWAFILDRRYGGIDVFLDPFVEQLLAVAVAVYKLLIAVFGIESPLPFQLAHVAVWIGLTTVLFFYLRRRVGEWLALAGLLPILFFGPAWDDLLFPFQISFLGALGCGVGALFALDREDLRGDLIAAVLLLIGLFCQHVAIGFVVAATIDIGFTRDRFRRAWVVAIPTAFWFAWYFGWGREAENFVSFHNFQTLIGYVADGLSSSLSSLLGLAIPRDEMTLNPLDWGRPLLVIAIAAGIWRVAKVGVAAMPGRFWAVLAAQLVFWSLCGLNAAFFGQATSGRYQIVGAVLWVMIAAELLKGVRVGRIATAVVVAIGLLAALANFSLLRSTAGGLANIAEQQRGGLAALELTRGEVADDFELTEANSGVDYLGIIDAASYFSAIDAFGSPAYTPDELAAAPDSARVAADRVFTAALGLGLTDADPSAGTACGPIRLGGEPALIPIPPDGAVLHSDDARAKVGVRRYAAEGAPVTIGRIAPGQSRELTIPPDLSQQPWQLGLEGSGSVEVCAR